jgi:uncharacterized protein (TIGR02246 family)
MAMRRLATIIVSGVLAFGASAVSLPAVPAIGASAVSPPAVPAASAPAAAPNSAGPELAAFKKAIRELYDLKERAWAAGDAETIVTRFYAPDAVSIGEGDPTTMVGREQFRATYRQYVKDVTSVRIESVRTVVNGAAGWDWTNFYATVRPEKAKDYPPPLVRVLFLWSKQNGRWICKGDVFVNGGFKEPL